VPTLKQLMMMSIISYFSDFAYPTVKDRMPAILTKVIDTILLSKSHSKLEIGSVSNATLCSRRLFFLPNFILFVFIISYYFILSTHISYIQSFVKDD